MATWVPGDFAKVGSQEYFFLKADGPEYAWFSRTPEWKAELVRLDAVTESHMGNHGLPISHLGRFGCHEVFVVGERLVGPFGCLGQQETFDLAKRLAAILARHLAEGLESALG